MGRMGRIFEGFVYRKNDEGLFCAIGKKQFSVICF